MVEYPAKRRQINTIYHIPKRIQPIRKLETHCIFCGMQRVVFHEKILAFLVNTSYLLLKGFYTFNEQYLLIFDFLSKLCTFKKRCQSVEYVFTDCICC